MNFVAKGVSNRWNVIQFLTEEYERGLFLSYLRRYKSAMKNYLPSHNSLFNRNPPPLPPFKTKYHAIWDANILLNFLENVSTISDMDVSRKLVCLLLFIRFTCELNFAFKNY